VHITSTNPTASDLDENLIGFGLGLGLFGNRELGRSNELKDFHGETMPTDFIDRQIFTSETFAGDGIRKNPFGRSRIRLAG